MLDLVQFVLALLGVVLGIILIIAQFQLFAIRRLLETLVQQMQTPAQQGRPEGAPAQVLPVNRPAVADLPPRTPAQRISNRILGSILLIVAIAAIGFAVFEVASHAK